MIKSVKGTKDYNETETFIINNMINICKQEAKLYDFIEIDTSILEHMELVKNMYNEDEFNKLVYTLDNYSNKQKETKLLLRYDLTLSLARYICKNKISNLRAFRVGKVYRRDNPQIAKGRYREFYQLDIDIVGSNNIYPELDIISYIDNVLKQILNNEKFVIHINSKQILYQILTKCGVEISSLKVVCSTIDKLDKLSLDEIKQELLLKEQNEIVINNIIDIINFINNNPKNLLDLLFDKNYIDSIQHTQMVNLFANLTKLGIDTFKFNPALARGLDYYTDIIYEVKLENSSIMNYSICAGGSYNNMINNISNRSVPAIGLSIGISRLLEIKKIIDKNININNYDIFVGSLGKNMTFERYLLCNELRNSNIKCTTSGTNNPNMRQQLDICFNKQIPLMLLIGENEINNGTVIIKIISDNKQFVIKRDSLIEEIKKY